MSSGDGGDGEAGQASCVVEARCIEVGSGEVGVAVGEREVVEADEEARSHVKMDYVFNINRLRWLTRCCFRPCKQRFYAILTTMNGSPVSEQSWLLLVNRAAPQPAAYMYQEFFFHLI